MKKALGIFVFIVLCLLSAATYIYFSIKDTIDAMIADVYPSINISYQQYNNFMDGRISLHNVSIDNGSAYDINVGVIELKLNSVFDYINIGEKLALGYIPPKLTLQINHIEVENSLEQQNATNLSSIAAYIGALACADIKVIDNKVLADLGYTNINSSILLNIEHNETNAITDLDLDIFMDGISKLIIQTSLSNIHSIDNLFDRKNELNKLEINIQDFGYNNKLIEYCSLKNNVKPEVYIEQHLQELKKYLATGKISLSENLYEAYFSYFVDNALLTISSQPQNTIDIRTVDPYQLEDWSTMLGLSVAVNEVPLNDISVSWDKSTSINTLLHSQSISALQQDEIQKTPNLSKVQKKQLEYVEVPISDLNKHVNAYIKLETKLGKTYKGHIKKVGNNFVAVVIHLKGGKAEIPINTNMVTKAFIRE